MILRRAVRRWLAAVGLTLLSATLSASHGPLSSPRSPTMLLIAAAKAGDLKEARHALARGASADARGLDGVTALMRACEGGDLDVVRLLLSKGAQVNDRSPKGMTALLFAVGHP